MRVRRLPRQILTLFPLLVAIGLLSPGAAALPTVKIPHANYAMYLYNAKVSVKGGTTLSNTYNASSGVVGTTHHESSTGSFSIDGTIQFIQFYKGTVPTVSGTAERGAVSVLNGTWTDQGDEWAPPDGETTEPFNCNGTIASTTGSANTSLKLTRSSGAVKAVLRLLTDQIENVPPRTCPDSSRAESLGEIEPEAYQNQFTIPKSKIGKKSFSMSISGPLAKYRSVLKVVCEGNPGGCTYNMAWQGVVTFTRTRTLNVKF